ncbi:MAG: biotin--[acetyl-CoA-carboxylase] ligase [Candidatus Eremiobacteraeota bacterium]|nr:biotin--[acetyl-CoA-carboxylase] ligase [Candidatus Eremiobacteraeota bacterium]
MPNPIAPLDGARVRDALAGTRFSDVRTIAETGSTNDDATALLGDPSAAGATLVAEFQTAGRGRKPGRSWIAPPGSALLMTAILPVAVAADALWAVPFWTALAVADGVEAGCGVRLDLRWPNDLDLDDHKACGILCVSRVAGATAHVGCGIGLNVHRPALRPETFVPAYLSDRAPRVEREAVLAAILGAMDGLVDVLERPHDVARAWEERAGLRGRPYRLRLDADGRVIDGTAVRLDPAGGLVVAVDGAERTIHLADARVVAGG